VAQIEGAQVGAWYEDAESWIEDWDETDANGAYELYTPAGTYTMEAYAEEGYESLMRRDVVFDGVDAVHSDFPLQPVGGGDTTRPTTTSNAKATYVSTATIKLTPSDTGSGVATTYYKLDGAAPVAGTTITTSVLGKHTLVFWSVDKANNPEFQQTVTFTVAAPVPPPVDSVAPVTTSDAVATYVSAATIKLTATDAGSGVAATYYQLDGAAPVAGATIGTSKIGNHTLVFWSVDRIGNTEAAKSVTFTVAKPKASITAPKAPKTMKRTKSYKIAGSLKSGRTKSTKPVRIYKYRKVNGKWKAAGYVKATFKGSKGYKATLKLTKKGKWRLRAYVPADGGHAATWSTKYDNVTVK